MSRLEITSGANALFGVQQPITDDSYVRQGYNERWKVAMPKFPIANTKYVFDTKEEALAWRDKYLRKIEKQLGRDYYDPMYLGWMKDKTKNNWFFRQHPGQPSLSFSSLEEAINARQNAIPQFKQNPLNFIKKEDPPGPVKQSWKDAYIHVDDDDDDPQGGATEDHPADDDPEEGAAEDNTADDDPQIDDKDYSLLTFPVPLPEPTDHISLPDDISMWPEKDVVSMFGALKL